MPSIFWIPSRRRRHAIFDPKRTYTTQSATVRFADKPDLATRVVNGRFSIASPATMRTKGGIRRSLQMRNLDGALEKADICKGPKLHPHLDRCIAA